VGGVNIVEKSLIRSISLRRRLILVFGAVIAALLLFVFLLILTFYNYSRQYNDIVLSAARANSYSNVFKVEMDSLMYNVVAGYREFGDGEQYRMIENLGGELRGLMGRSSDGAETIELDIILRTLETLRKYVDLTGEQIARDEPVAAEMVTLDQISSITTLINQEIQDYLVLKIHAMEKANQDLQRGLLFWVVVILVVTVALIAAAALLTVYISNSVSDPVKKLIEMSMAVSAGDFSTRVIDGNRDEIARLSDSFNEMTERVSELIDRVREEQAKLRDAEFRLLSAQINPHFLYNTLETIVWMAESRQNDKVIAVTKALSNFFRKSLAGGRDIATVAEEIEQVESYLLIQQMRYSDTMTYSIRVDTAAADCLVPKLTLQPIVENALYHGLKNKRGGGIIEITAEAGEDAAIITVRDTGAGMTRERLAALRRRVDSPPESADVDGIGLANVSGRLRLGFGEGYGVAVDSEYGAGTTVRIRVPRKG
jgi:two-component system sensor histidine kinase YesM